MRNKIAALAALVSLALGGQGWAQTSPNLVYGQVLSAAQWNALFAAKFDYPGLTFSSVQSGLVPASGGGTANFLRADGTWAPGQGDVSGPPSSTNGYIPTWNGLSGTNLNAGLPTTGTAGSVVLSLSPSITTPALTGVTNGSNAAAGILGEYVCAQVWNGGSPSGCVANTGTAVALAPGTSTSITSVSLAAGDWDVCANFNWNNLGSSTTDASAGISTLSATLPSVNSPTTGNIGTAQGVTFNGNSQAMAVGCTRESLSTTTTVYLVGALQGTGANGSGWGYISARRVR